MSEHFIPHGGVIGGPLTFRCGVALDEHCADNQANRVIVSTPKTHFGRAAVTVEKGRATAPFSSYETPDLTKCGISRLHPEELSLRRRLSWHRDRVASGTPDQEQR